MIRTEELFCPGTVANGPDKRFTRCSICGRISWEKEEGDICGARLQPRLGTTAFEVQAEDLDGGAA